MLRVVKSGKAILRLKNGRKKIVPYFDLENGERYLLINKKRRRSKTVMIKVIENGGEK